MNNSIILQIEELHRASPFHPFTLALDDGKKLVIERPEFLGLFPKRDKVFYSAADDTTRVLDVARIVNVEVKRRRRAS